MSEHKFVGIFVGFYRNISEKNILKQRYKHKVRFREGRHFSIILSEKLWPPHACVGGCGVWPCSLIQRHGEDPIIAAIADSRSDIYNFKINTLHLSLSLGVLRRRGY